MIFIIIAVIVLFVSFVIALFSLVREQRKIEKVEESVLGEPVDVQPTTQDAPETESALLNKPEVSSVHTEATEHTQEVLGPLAEQGDRFPWEVEPKIPVVQNAEEDEIEKIRAEIARMQNPGKVQEDALTIGDKKVEASEDKDDGRLTGEFQIRHDN